MIGSKSGMLTIVSFSHKASAVNYWNAECECGRSKKISTGEFNRGRTPVLSCGCFKPNRIIDIVGFRSGSLLVLNFSCQKKLKSYWNCKCDCGNEKIICGESLTRKLTTSCGCLKKRQAIQRRRNIKEQFLNRLQKKENGCWEWTGRKDRDGYGLSKGIYPDQRSHRSSFKLFKSEITNGMYICHTCDNPCCCNPEHLYMGTHSDNTRDAIERNRLSRGPCPQKALKGEKNPKSKLNEPMVLTIRRLHDSFKITHSQIAKQFGIHKTTAQRIVRRETWKHI